MKNHTWSSARFLRNFDLFWLYYSLIGNTWWKKASLFNNSNNILSSRNIFFHNKPPFHIDSTEFEELFLVYDRILQLFKFEKLNTIKYIEFSKRFIHKCYTETNVLGKKV